MVSSDEQEVLEWTDGSDDGDGGDNSGRDFESYEVQGLDEQVAREGYRPSSQVFAGPIGGSASKANASVARTG